MKVKRIEGHFEPIEIIVENVNEAMAIADALRAYRCARNERGFTKPCGLTPKDEITIALLAQLSEMGY